MTIKTNRRTKKMVYSGKPARKSKKVTKKVVVNTKSLRAAKVPLKEVVKVQNIVVEQLGLPGVGVTEVINGRSTNAPVERSSVESGSQVSDGV